VSGLVSLGLGIVIWVYGLAAFAHAAGVLLGLDLAFTGLVVVSVAGALRDYSHHPRQTHA
jgi:hypothetical protein